MTLFRQNGSAARQHWSDAVVVALLIVMPMVWFQRVFISLLGIGTDIVAHARWTQLLLDDPQQFFSRVAHWLYHVTVAGFGLLAGMDVYNATVIILVLTHIVLGLMIYGVLRWRFELNHAMRLGVSGLILVLLIVAPIHLLTPERPYFGYMNITLYHNPTTIFLRPFALAFFLLGLMIFYPRNYFFKWGTLGERVAIVGLSAVVVILGTIAKPSFTLVYVPALVLFAGWRWWRGSDVQWVWLIAGLILPSVVVIGYQTFVIDTGQGIPVGRPMIAPFELFRLWEGQGRTGAGQFLGAKYLLSIAFPLSVYLTHWREARQSIQLNLAFLTMVCASFYAYFVIFENFSSAGDFTWGAVVSNFILFMSTVFFLVRVYGAGRRRGGWRLGISLMILGLHVSAGIFWYSINAYHMDIYLSRY